MSLLGIRQIAETFDRLLGTTSARPVTVEQNGHATFDDEPGTLRVESSVPRDDLMAALVAERDNAYDDRDAFHAKARALGKAYGRASRTIGEQRGTIASLRAQLAAALCNDETPGATLVDVAAGKPGQDAAAGGAVGTPAGGAGERPPAGTDPERMLTPRQQRDMRRLLGLEPEPFDRHVDRIGDDLAALGLLKPAPAAVRETVVRVLTDHELLADDTCRCGWGTRHYTDPPCDPLCADSPMWHAEHVAMQLAAQGVTAEPIRTRESYVFGKDADVLPVGTVLLLDVDPPVTAPLIRGRRGWITPDALDGPRDLHRTSRFRVLYRPEALK
jgi:hypothetical protein